MPAAAASQGSEALASENVVRAHARLLHDASLQFGFDPIPPPVVPGWLKLLGQMLKGIAPVLGWIFWIGLALAALTVLAFILREVVATRWPKRARRAPAAAPAETWRPAPAQARALLEEADALAGRGLYAEAARLLLHRSIADLDERRPRTVAPALTARDIAALRALPDGARPAFRQIATVVERSLFGGRPVGETEFAACRRAYEDFALPGGWS